MENGSFVIEEYQAEVPLPELLRHRDVSRVLAMCGSCPNHGRVWACPPHADDYLAHLLDGYTVATVIGTRVCFSEATRAQCVSAEQRKQVSAEAIEEVWKKLLPRLYALEREHPHSRMFAGRCRLCGEQPCTRITGEPCRHPHAMRHSLEAVGFDVVGIAREFLGLELEWSAGAELPQHITVVTAHFKRQ